MNPAQPAAPRGQRLFERRLRIATGLVLFSFVSTHLINHALGLVSLSAMEAGRDVFVAFWRSLPATLLLSTSIAIHLALALRSIYLRRTFRLPLWEALQLVLGLSVPLLVVNHVVGTRIAHELFGFEDSYRVMVLLFWSLRPDLGAKQTVLLLVAWIHGCIGLHFWLRFRPAYPRYAMLLFAAALLLPTLALLGFVQAGKEVAVLAARAGWVGETFAAAHAPDRQALAVLAEIGQGVSWLFAGALALTLALRAARDWIERRSAVRVTYPGGRVETVPRGFSLLECSRRARIPHASVCGGRGRCSTCRVRIVDGIQSLPPPSAAEARVLHRIGATPEVRLACQSRPVGDLSIIPLMPASLLPADASTHQGALTGEEREVCVLFADIRGFTRLSERRLPYDVVFFLNRYFDVTSRAIEGAGGIANQFTGDGVMALFGVNAPPEVAARQALDAARALTRAVSGLGADLRGELRAPLRIGIGIHSGSAVVGHMGQGVAAYLTAVGDTVNTASRLQDQTKEFDCQAIISEAVAQRAGLDVSGLPRHEITVRNRAEPIAVRIIADVEALHLP